MAKQTSLSHWFPPTKKRRTDERYGTLRDHQMYTVVIKKLFQYRPQHDHLTSESSDEENCNATSQRVPTSEIACTEAAVSSGPHQVKDPIIIKKIQGKKSRYFCMDWFKDYPWLILCATRLKSFCYLCKYCSEKGFTLR